MAVTSANSEAGFTLVEILCVLALLGLTAGLVVLNLPKPPPPFKTEITSATSLLNLVARESVIDGKTRGLEISSSGLEILTYDGQWVSEGQRNFEHVFGLELLVEQQPIDLTERQRKKEKADDDKSETALTPLIYFDATGNVTPFTISVRGEGETFSLAPNPRGRIIMESVE